MIKKCSFPPSSIVILGQKQGGMVALASVATWDLIQFAGVVSIGAFLPTFTATLKREQVHTPAIIIVEETRYSAESAQWQQSKALFHHVDKVGLGDLKVEGTIENIEKKWQPLLDFYAHRLRREEWTKQSIITFGKQNIVQIWALSIS